MSRSDAPSGEFRPSDGIRTLIVLTNAYGELSLAHGFAQGQQFARNGLMLLPDRLWEARPDLDPLRCARYSSLSEIVRVVG